VIAMTQKWAWHTLQTESFLQEKRWQLQKECCHLCETVPSPFANYNMIKTYAGLSKTQVVQRLIGMHLTRLRQKTHIHHPFT